MIGRLAWVTTREARGLDEDEPAALAALGRTGVVVEVVDWDDAGVDWAGFDRAVIRSTWDYTARLDEFLSWVDEVARQTELVNPPAMVRWSLDKSYLADLDAGGVPITPTVFVPPGSRPTFPDGDLVVKPAVGAGSRDAASYGAGQQDLAEAHVSRLHGVGQVVLVQPLLPSVAVDGEWALMFLHGAYSHAACKRVALPRAGAVEGLFAAETTVAHDATPDQLAVAAGAVDLVTDRFGTPTYTRVDIVRDEDGRYCVLEVELVEPSLFLPYAGTAAADRLAEALVRR